MRNFKQFFTGDLSTLGLRLWEFTGSALVNLLVCFLLLVILSPLSYMVLTSLKDSIQFLDPKSPIWPAEAQSIVYQGQTDYIYQVPAADGWHNWALVTARRTASDFVDPAHPELGLIHWTGNWRGLSLVYHFKPDFNNYVQLFKDVNYPQYLRNSLILVALGEIGILWSSIAVAYGLSRFRVPGGKYLLMLLIATIVIPDSITVIPNFIAFTRILGWNGTFLPMVVPQFFGSAVYIFLLRQNFRSIPRDLDESAMIDGAGPVRILTSIILPQCIPAVMTVALLEFFNTWNELRVSSLYLSTRPQLQPISFTAQFTPAIGFTPEFLQASALLLLIVPIVVLFVAQRFFMQDMVVTGLEK